MKNALITALATPYKKGKIDFNSYAELVRRQADYADGILCCGTTAEAQLLTECEKKLLITAAKETAVNTPVIAGIEEADTLKAVKCAEKYEKYGADALLVAPPAFCKCTASGYYRHIKAIKNAVSVPLVLYNIPARCGYILNKNVLKKLHEKEGINYIKDAGDDLNYTADISRFLIVFSGNDGLLTSSLNCGAKGVISVVSNVAPLLTRKVLNGEYSEIFQTLAEISMREVNPVPVKYMLYKSGIFDDYAMRLPLTRARRQTRREIDGFWKRFEGEIK